MKTKISRYVTAISLVAALALTLLLGGCINTTNDIKLTTGTTATDAGARTTVSTDADERTDGDTDEADETVDSDTGEALPVTLADGASSSSADGVSVDGDVVTIGKPGVYSLSGTLSDGSIVVDCSNDEEVTLVFDGVDITSADGAALYVRQADKVKIVLSEGTTNKLANGGVFADNEGDGVDAVVFSRDDITFKGSGSLTVSSPAGQAVVGKDDVKITDGTYIISSLKTAIRANDDLTVKGGDFEITAGTDGLHAENNNDDTLGSICIADGSFVINAGDDAVHANALLQIDGGVLDITAAEGLEATYVLINGGVVSIDASDDGINAARKSSAYSSAVEINGGDITITMGPGDTDGVDSNGDIIITGGTVSVTGQSTFDCDGEARLTGGTVYVNGQQVDTLPNQFGGGFGGFGGPPLR